jgi:hypothetical protein
MGEILANDDTLPTGQTQSMAGKVGWTINLVARSGGGRERPQLDERKAC